MDWLSQNWVWVAIAIGALIFFSRRGGHGGHGAGHGGGHGHGGSGSHGGGHGDQRPPASPPQAAIDPVSGAAVRTADALSSVYQGKVYYFASRENRERFEAAPQDYAQKAAGQAAASAGAPERQAHRRHGC